MHPNRTWTRAFINTLPDSAFLYVAPGGHHDARGRTVPRTLRHFPYKNSSGNVDVAHLRNALSRIPQSALPASVKTRIEAEARRLYERAGGYQSLAQNPPPPPPRRRRLPMPPRPSGRLPEGARPSTLRRVSGMVREHEKEERPFDPERAPTWRGPARDLSVNPHRRNAGEGSELYLNPYANSAAGVYVDSLAKYQDAAEQLAKKGYEEFEVDFIDGSREHAALFQALKIGPSDVETWYDTIEGLADDQMATLYHRADNGYDWRAELDDIVDRNMDNWARQGSAEDYVRELVDDIGVGGVVNNQYYFDYDRFGRDLRLSGDLTGGLETQEEIDEADEKYDRMSDREIGEETVDDIYGGVEHLPKETQEQYFDYEALARDMNYNGEIDEFEFGGTTYNIDTR